MHPLETYLQELRAVRSSGAAVKETSYYPALSTLLNEIGKTLKPKVKCIVHLQDTGAGIPDGGLFTEEQTRNDVNDLRSGAIPARGAIEAKPTSADAWRIAESKPIRRPTAPCWKRIGWRPTSTTFGPRLLIPVLLRTSRARVSRDFSSA